MMNWWSDHENLTCKSNMLVFCLSFLSGSHSIKGSMVIVSFPLTLNLSERHFYNENNLPDMDEAIEK